MRNQISLASDLNLNGFKISSASVVMSVMYRLKIRKYFIFYKGTYCCLVALPLPSSDRCKDQGVACAIGHNEEYLGKSQSGLFLSLVSLSHLSFLVFFKQIWNEHNIGKAKDN